MSKAKKKSYNIIEKIGKRNLILFFFIIIVVVIARLYNTFSLNTEISQTYINGIKTYQFIVNSSKDNNSITLAEKSSKNITIKITNPDNTKLKYGLYYSSNDSLNDVYIGYKKESKKPATGLIDGNDNYLIDLKIINLSNRNVVVDFGIAYGLENGGDLTLPESNKWIEKYNGPELLTEAKIGSYIYYEGNNGCNIATCYGTNKNTSDQSKGYCFKDDAQFKSDGWRLAYIKNDTPYIISAGAIDCIASDSKGSTDDKVLNSYEKDLGLPNHTSLLNKKALTYCNRKYAYKNACNNHSGWAMDVIDFKNITNEVLSSDKCFKQKGKKECGFENDIIDNGSYYWFANANNGVANTMFYWDPKEKFVNSSFTNNPLGIRPVLRLNESVYVIKGTGTEKEPYLLDTFIEDENYNALEEEKEETKNVKYISDYIKEEYNNGKEITTIDINGKDAQVKINTDSSILLDNNNIYRYFGDNPHNYVMYNDELWRIISLSNVKKDKDDSKEKMRAKIIRINPIGKYSYDSSKKDSNDGKGINDWSKSDLMQELNNLYYNQKSGSCYIDIDDSKTECDFSVIGLDSNAKYLIDDALYYLSNEDEEISDLYPNEYYKKERSNKTWSGKIGLIYGSDYMYAANLNTCKENSAGYLNNSNCNTNWLYKMHSNVMSNLELSPPAIAREIYPVVYLKENIIISEGTGTKDNPLILEIDS
ncbi:MAG: hypothetical protein IKF19_03845 [Bacilli bacterium]|nr:hypothetical protein [Bacilli bacterium]